MLFYIAYAIFLFITIFKICQIIRQQSNNNTRNSARVIRQITILAFVDVLILFIPYFLRINIVRDNTTIPWWLLPPYLIIHLLQTGSLDADYSAVFLLAENESLHLAPWFSNLYMITLSYLSASIPVMGVLFVSTAFYNKVGYYLLRLFPLRWENLYVFNEINPASLSLIASMADDHPRSQKIRFIFCSLPEDPTGEAADRLKNLRVSFTSKGPSSVLSDFFFYLNRRNIHFFFLAENEDQNLEDTIDALRTAGRLSGIKITGRIFRHIIKPNQISEHVKIVLATESDELGNIMDSQEKHGIAVRLIDRELYSAYDLFLRWPLFLTYGMPLPQPKKEAEDAASSGTSANLPDPRRQRDKVTLLIAGGSATAHTICRTALWMGRSSRMDLSVIYVGEDAALLEQNMRASCQGLFSKTMGGGENFDLHFIKSSLKELLLSASGTSSRADASTCERLRQLLVPVNYVVLAGEDDENNISDGMQLRSWYGRHFQRDVNSPFIAARIHSQNKMRKLSGLRIMDSRALTYNLQAFGTDEHIFSYGMILANPIADMMENIQYSYFMPPSDEGMDLKDLPSDPKQMEKYLSDREKAHQELNASTYSYQSTQANAAYCLVRIFDSGAAQTYLEQRGLPSDGRAQRDLLVSAFFADLDSDPQAIETPIPSESDSLSVGEEILDLYMQKTSDPEILDQMARAEHSRWNSYMICCGWISMSTEDMKAYCLAHKGNHKDYLGLRHPCITTWEGLEEISVIKSSFDKDGNPLPLHKNGKPVPRNTQKFYDSDRMMVRRLKYVMQFKSKS